METDAGEVQLGSVEGDLCRPDRVGNHDAFVFGRRSLRSARPSTRTGM